MFVDSSADLLPPIVNKAKTFPPRKLLIATCLKYSGVVTDPGDEPLMPNTPVVGSYDRVQGIALQLPFCFEVRALSDRLVSSTPE
jgi:hypothetical protein